MGIGAAHPRPAAVADEITAVLARACHRPGAGLVDGPPMSVVTTLRLIGDEGEVLTALESARFLNEIVHALPWQSEVQRALHVGHA